MSADAYVPQWRVIERSLRERIARMVPGDPLPSDAQLCSEFGVSRMTARHAIQRLADDGLVLRQPGRGTYVATPPANRRADRLLSFSLEMERAGRAPSSRLLEFTQRPATAGEAAALAVEAGDTVVVLRRLRCADGLPIAVETALLIGGTAEAITAADLERSSLHGVLAAAGYHLRRGSAAISAVAATDEDARLLEVRLGDPILVERRVIEDTRGVRIEATESRYRADRYALGVQFEVEGRDSATPPTPSDSLRP